MIKTIKPSYLTEKTLPLPKGLFYKHNNCDYTLINVSSGKLVGTMCAEAITFDPNSLYKKKENEKIFHIYTLNILPNEQNKHWGEYFMNFAKKESFKQKCDGRLSLIAYNEKTSPHVFYWKQGLKSKDNNINRILKKCAEENSIPFFFNATAMYLPIKKEKKSIKTFHLKNILYNAKKLLNFNR